MKTKDPISIKPIRKQTVPEQIIHEFKSLIDSGQITPGSRLPGERELAEMLNVSRPSLREALRALSLLGIVENRHGSGTFLSASPDRWPSEPFSIMLSIKRGMLFDIFEARKCLEGSVAELAARRRSDEDLQAMEEALKQMRLTVRNPEQYPIYEMEFHRAIVEAAGNAVIADLMEKLYNLLKDTRGGINGYTSEATAFRDEDLRNHQVILDRIKEGDGVRATKAMIDHLMNFERRLQDEQQKQR